MVQPGFFDRPEPLTLAEIAALTKAELSDGSRGATPVKGLAVLDQAGPSHLTFFDNMKYLPQLAHCHAAACFVKPRLAAHLPASVVALRVTDPYRAFVAVARQMYPDALKPGSMSGGDGVSERAVVHPTARLEDDVIVEPGAVIGAHAEIGTGTLIGPNAVIGPNVCIGRHCSVGANATIICSLIGNHVTIHPGCHIGQDGYGYVPAARGHIKVPQIGRVIIQDFVEIGAGTTIDRGAVRDTTIGEGTKIDNLVQIAHNVAIGRHCFVVAQVGISGSATIGDGVALGARAGVANHAHIGDGAQVAALAIVLHDLPGRKTYGGFPAKPYKKWVREVLTIEKLAERGFANLGPGKDKGQHDSQDIGNDGDDSNGSKDEGTQT